MAFVIDGAPEGFQDNLALFTVPPVETGIQDIYVKEFRPVGVVSGSSVLEFDVQNNSSDYIMLDKARINLSLKIINDEGKPIGEQDVVSLINCPGGSIFRQVDLNLQQTLISSSIGTNYPYKVMFDLLLSCGVNDQLSWLSIGGYSKDTAGLLDDFDGSGNTGFIQRQEFTKNGKTGMFSCKLFLDITNQKRFILNGVPINIKLFPACDTFRLMYKTYEETYEGQFISSIPVSDVDLDPPATKKLKSTPVRSSKYYSVHISDASLSIPFVKIHPGLITQHNEMISKSPAIYPFERSDIKAFNIPINSYSWSMENLFQDSIPKKLVIAFVASTAYSGNNQRNPFKFHHFDLNYLNFQVNGQNAPAQPLQPNFDEKHAVRSYATLFESAPPWQKEASSISYLEYLAGYTIFVLDLEKSKGQDFTNPVKKGNTSISVRFKKALPEPVTVLAYGTFDSLMNIDVARNVIVQS